MEPSILPTVIGKYKARLVALAFVKQPILEEEKSKFESALLCLKIDPITSACKIVWVITYFSSIVPLIEELLFEAMLHNESVGY